MHIVDDYYLQGILSSLKQKKWWRDNCPDDLYKNDYRIALLEHAYSWSFVISIPVFIYLLYFNKLGAWFYVLFILNVIVHHLVDDLKANKRTINLVQDQLIHLSQIIFTWLIVILV